MDVFSLNKAWAILKPLALLASEMIVYAVLVFHYYRFMARRDIIKFDIDRYKSSGDRAITGFVNFFQTIIIYPFYSICLVHCIGRGTGVCR